MISQNIVIVEDELGVAQPLKKGNLTPNRLYQVEIYSSAEEALERMQNKRFDLLVTDFRLPGMDGLEFLEKIQSLTPETRSILITAFGSPELEQRVRDLADVYIPKPYHLRDIIAAIQKLLVEIEPAEPAPAAIGPDTSLVKTIVTPLVERRRLTHLNILASDLDGTLAINGVVPPQTWELLRMAKQNGITLILVTGRVLDTFINTGPYTEIFEVIVAEDGAVVFFPKKNVIQQPFGRLSPI